MTEVDKWIDEQRPTEDPILKEFIRMGWYAAKAHTIKQRVEEQRREAEPA